jgi:hypothetical protein
LAGTFQNANGEVVITYDPSLVERPYNLIATFAHELAHYGLHDIKEPPPGAHIEPTIARIGDRACGRILRVCADLARNAAFDFHQTQDFGRQGWRSSFSGYFSEDSWAFALAVFMALRGEAPGEAQRHLKPRLACKLDGARKRLDGEPALIASLLAIAT